MVVGNADYGLKQKVLKAVKSVFLEIIPFPWSIFLIAVLFLHYLKFEGGEEQFMTCEGFEIPTIGF